MHPYGAVTSSVPMRYCRQKIAPGRVTPSGFWPETLLLLPPLLPEQGFRSSLFFRRGIRWRFVTATAARRAFLLLRPGGGKSGPQDGDDQQMCYAHEVILMPS